jgi:putative colanic acid biosynthesis acetyltransferase WcaF
MHEQRRSAVRLDLFHTGGFDRGRSALVDALWLVAQGLFFSSWIPGSAHRVVLLRLFGARIGKGVVIKPRVQVKFPWRLEIGDFSWLGEGAWIDNLAQVTIGAHCCISQGAYLCTGSHDWSSETFDLIVKPITIGQGAWLAASSVVGPGVTVGSGAVLTLSSAAVTDLQPGWIHSGVPARPIRARPAAAA